MVAHRGDRSDGDPDREASASRTPRHRRSSRSKRDRYDQDSIDSGYGGSADFPSPRLDKQRKHDADNHGHDADSDSDYDPKAKYYLTVDDNDYKNISFQGGEAPDQPESSKAKGERQGHEDDDMTKRRRSDHDRHRSSSHRHRSRTTSSSGSDSDSYARGYSGRSRRRSSRRYSDSSRPRPQREPFRRTLSPVLSEPSDDWRDSPERQIMTSPRSTSRSPRRQRASTAGSSDLRSPSPEADEIQPLQRSSDRSRRSRTRARIPTEKDGPKRELSKGGSSSYKGAADMDDAWYKTFKERLTKGVDMNQVKKVGFDAAAVAAVKVAVGTQIPWKQRIPKTIAVGLAAAVTDFLVSKTSFQPKGMVGTSE